MEHTSNHLSWNAQALWQQLSPLLPGLEVQVLAEAGSTNTLLMERARRQGPNGRGSDERQPGRRADDTAPTLLVAEAQTQGRGRQGRSWQAAAGASLTFSLSLRLAPPDWSGLSLAVGVALADALDPWPEPAAGRALPRIGLKWPNDLLVMDEPGHGRKLAGTLIETVGTGGQRMVVVGVGINVLPLPLRDLSQGFACLHELDPAANAPLTLLQVALPLAQALKRFEAEGFAPVAPLYARRDALAGQTVRTSMIGLPEGVAEGVDHDGALLVRASGQLQRVNAGDVSVRLQGEATGPGPLEAR